MRGTHDRLRPGPQHRGIIPAYAGNTEHGQHTCFSAAGSSPHMRGTLTCTLGSRRSPGIIPAYAGNTHFIVIIAVARRDHPRICGEHLSPIIVARRTMGSSPHMRGTLQPHVRHADSHGIIPAYAGNTVTACVLKNTPGDHPRICGEHHLCSQSLVFRSGSSPHMRGTHYGENAGGHIHGIIPAYAGNTTMPPPSMSLPRDHPRICGEHTKRL